MSDLIDQYRTVSTRYCIKSYMIESKKICCSLTSLLVFVTSIVRQSSLYLHPRSRIQHHNLRRHLAFYSRSFTFFCRQSNIVRRAREDKCLVHILFTYKGATSTSTKQSTVRSNRFDTPPQRYSASKKVQYSD